MAEAPAIVLPSGYEDEFVNAVEEDLLCSICHLALKEAVQTGKCGHRFCMQCLDEHFRRFVIQSIVGKLLNVRVLYAIRYSLSKLLYLNLPWLRLKEARRSDECRSCELRRST